MAAKRESVVRARRTGLATVLRSSSPCSAINTSALIIGPLPADVRTCAPRLEYAKSGAHSRDRLLFLICVRRRFFWRSKFGPDRLEYGSFDTTPRHAPRPLRDSVRPRRRRHGEVYKARDTRLDRTVEIKIIPESLAADPQFRERFDRDVIRVARWGFEPPYPRYKINYRGERRL